jgi:hypothetical protein
MLGGRGATASLLATSCALFVTLCLHALLLQWSHSESTAAGTSTASATTFEETLWIGITKWESNQALESCIRNISATGVTQESPLSLVMLRTPIPTGLWLRTLWGGRRACRKCDVVFGESPTPAFALSPLLTLSPSSAGVTLLWVHTMPLAPLPTLEVCPLTLFREKNGKRNERGQMQMQVQQLVQADSRRAYNTTLETQNPISLRRNDTSILKEVHPCLVERWRQSSSTS